MKLGLKGTVSRARVKLKVELEAEAIDSGNSCIIVDV
jgi:hypothetical protein